DGAGTNRSPKVLEIQRVSEIQTRVEINAYAGDRADYSDNDLPNNEECPISVRSLRSSRGVDHIDQ
ncbi:hypothetical protein HAX54_008215, partial [Datura stramonium]|nr:hypothetical protein [Datura stramonium]